MATALADVAAQASAAYELLLSSMETVLRFGSIDQAGLIQDCDTALEA